MRAKHGIYSRLPHFDPNFPLARHVNDHKAWWLVFTHKLTKQCSLKLELLSLTKVIVL